MTGRRPGLASRQGSILLPVIVVLLLIASAATAMTLQARTSLREAATRRDRLALGFVADAAVRAAALALGEALASRAQPPFALDGTPQSCVLPNGGRLVLSVQDEGGLVDLNKGSETLLLLVMQRAGLSGWDAKAITKSIMGRRDPHGPSGGDGRGRGSRNAGTAGFGTVDEIGDLPGMTEEAFERLRPALSVLNGAAGIDPAVMGPGLRAMISAKELGGPAFKDDLAPSMHGAFTLTSTAVAARGMRVRRRGAVELPANGSAPRFIAWDAPVSLERLAGIADGAFCARVASALGRLAPAS